ncbi:MAG: nitroreductase family protein [Deltaproteobacteria bacterium]|nr:nitroreductase family protein [Deltaproteobacteria bacterium]
MADFNELLRNRRSIRDFEDKDVPLELIEEIVKDSCLAPSSGNGQPWRFVIVKNGEWIERLSEESKKNFLSYLDENPDAPIKKYEKTLRKEGFNVFYNAPCLVFILGPKSIQSVHVDCALAACYFMFSAAEMGLGTCWVGLGANIRDPEICRTIGIPEDCRIVAPIILGYPKNVPAPPRRNEPQILKVVL